MAMKGGNKQNLRVPTSEQARINGRKGGIASQKAQRERKTLKEYALALLDAETTMKDGSKKANREMLLLAQFKKAVQDGDLNSAKWLAELIGENPVKSLELTGKDGSDLNKGPITIEVITSKDQVVTKEEES